MFVFFFVKQVGREDNELNAIQHPIPFMEVSVFRLELLGMILDLGSSWELLGNPGHGWNGFKSGRYLPMELSVWDTDYESRTFF